MNLLIFYKLLKKLRLMSIQINRLEEGHNSYPLVCPRPAETVPFQRRQICYRWGIPACWSLVPRSSMFYLFEFCLKNMWNCSLIQHILNHCFHDWKLCEWFLLSGFLICHAVGWYKYGDHIKSHDKCMCLFLTIACCTQIHPWTIAILIAYSLINYIEFLYFANWVAWYKHATI